MSTGKQPSLLVSGSCFMMSWCFKLLALLTAPAHLILEDPTAWLNLQAVPDALASQLFLLSLAFIMLWGYNFCIWNMGAKLAYFFLIHSFRRKMFSHQWFFFLFSNFLQYLSYLWVNNCHLFNQGNTLHLLFGLLWLSASALWLLLS